MLEKVNVSIVRELLNNLGFKDREVRKLVVDNIYNGSWKQEHYNSLWLSPGSETIEAPLKNFLNKKSKKTNFDFNTPDTLKLSEEANKLLDAIR